MRKILIASLVFGFSSSAFAAPTSEKARKLSSVALTAQSRINAILQNRINLFSNLGNENMSDDKVINLLGEASNRLSEGTEKLNYAAYFLDAADFARGTQFFNVGCGGIARAGLKIASARLASLTSNMFSPYSSDMSDMDQDLKQGRSDNDCP